MGKKRLLVIEDDMDVAELLLMYFTSQGYEIFHADMGGEGIALARSKLPNLILLDIMLPDMEGFEVCKQLRETNLTKYIPIIFLTQRNATADKISGFERGADGYITKPFDIEELRLRVKTSIERATRDHLHEIVTGLPTGPLIEDEFRNFSESSVSWNRLNIQIVGFEAFRTAYGFLTANDALSLAARILTDVVVEMGTTRDFLGVTEPGQFVVLTHAEDAEKLSSSLEKDFAERAQILYKFTDVDQGFILLNEGLPDEKKEPLMHFKIDIQKSPATS